MTLPVLIIGAGLGGICLAQALRKNNIPFKLFEQDEHHNLRTQGYRLRITEHGANALRDSLTPDLFTLFQESCATTAGFGVHVKPDGTSIPFGPNSPPGPPPGMTSDEAYTVDRSTFREALLTGIEEHTFFGKSFEYYELTDNGITAYFGDGSVVKGSLLVGADGVNSRVRKQYLPKYPAIDTGMRIVFGKTPITSEFLDSVPESYQVGLSLASDPGDKSQPALLWEAIRFPCTVEKIKLPSPYMYWVLVFHRSRLPFSDEKGWRLKSDEAADLARELTKSWIPSVRSVVDMQDENQSSMRSLLSAEIEIGPWVSSARVTLLGDAIHVMPPTGAMGANTALRDAADLARRIADAGGAEKVDEGVIGEYEDGLRAFAKMAIDKSWKGGMKSFGLRPVEECEKIVL
ncbi:uncharacterized protein N7484_002030 [Penicillium longicatenatum]|uniref:uncharacterized protein n=1 Tax=Penicillium longicatenatum TaxID=1561947 RepID=UPI0025488E4F|nr:uncharacterized protein N7484_002030 [Penicillium longicatenatum]KAJ5658381.1 hypothetical protein N7484_002030 [Penicillium longicatenatum]